MKANSHDIEYPEFKPIKNVMPETIEDIQNIGSIRGIASGYQTLDNLKQGFIPGEFTVIGGRPSMGTSSLMNCMTINMAKVNFKVGIISYDFTGEMISLQMLAIESRININILRKGRIQPDQWFDIEDSVNNLNNLDISFLTNPPLKFDSFIELMINYKKDSGLDILFIDKLQGIRNFVKDKYQERAFIWQKLKILAVTLDIPVIGLSDLPRKVEAREDTVPRLSDLTCFNNLDYFADNVIFLYRKIVYSKHPEHEGIADLYISKNSRGPIGTTQLEYLKTIGRFNNIDFTENEIF